MPRWHKWTASLQLRSPLFRLTGTTPLLVHRVDGLEELLDLLARFLGQALETPEQRGDPVMSTSGAWMFLGCPFSSSVYGTVSEVTRHLRGHLETVLTEDYIRTARAKGARLWRHLYIDGLVVAAPCECFPALAAQLLALAEFFSNFLPRPLISPRKRSTGHTWVFLQPQHRG